MLYKPNKIKSILHVVTVIQIPNVEVNKFNTIPKHATSKVHITVTAEVRNFKSMSFKPDQDKTPMISPYHIYFIFSSLDILNVNLKLHRTSSLQFLRAQMPSTYSLLNDNHSLFLRGVTYKTLILLSVLDIEGRTDL